MHVYELGAALILAPSVLVITSQNPKTLKKEPLQTHEKSKFILGFVFLNWLRERIWCEKCKIRSNFDQFLACLMFYERSILVWIGEARISAARRRIFENLQKISKIEKMHYFSVFSKYFKTLR